MQTRDLLCKYSVFCIQVLKVWGESGEPPNEIHRIGN